MSVTTCTVCEHKYSNTSGEAPCPLESSHEILLRKKAERLKNKDDWQSPKEKA